MKDGQTQKRATYNLTKSSGGLNNMKNASSIPKVTEAYEISRKHNINTTDPLKLLIQKQQEDKKNWRWSNRKDSDKPTILLFLMTA